MNDQNNIGVLFHNNIYTKYRMIQYWIKNIRTLQEKINRNTLIAYFIDTKIMNCSSLFVKY